jgi:hypothetical protein
MRPSIGTIKAPGKSETFESPYNVQYTNFTPQSKELGKNLLGIPDYGR